MGGPMDFSFGLPLWAIIADDDELHVFNQMCAPVLFLDRW